MMNTFMATPNKLRLFSHKAAAGDSSAPLPVKGQGTVSVLITSDQRPFTITFKPAQGEFPAMGLSIDPGVVQLWYDGGAGRQTLKVGQGKTIGLNAEGTTEPYWLSLDSNNSRVRYGKGEMLRTLTLFEFSWASDAELSKVMAFPKDLARVQVAPVAVTALEVLPIPVNLDPSPYIVSPDAVTMESLSFNMNSVIADLPPACQQLYATVAGRGITITPADFPEFPQAIQHSIVTPGCICYNELAKKDPAFGYLRVTIDGNLGDSPGQPYVLEIWPAGNGSPIHNHGRACAIIHVLFGQIEVSLFPALSPSILAPWGKVTFKTGDVTFLTPDYYQIHQLQNPLPRGAEFCATIQSYRYPDTDHVHYEYFDYIDGNQIKQFTPDSDWTYLEFKRLIQQEWKESQ
jgi:hypothetical protein